MEFCVSVKLSLVVSFSKYPYTVYITTYVEASCTCRLLSFILLGHIFLTIENFFTFELWKVTYRSKTDIHHTSCYTHVNSN